MRVMIQLREDAAAALQGKPDQKRAAAQGVPEIKRLLEAAAGMGIRLEPVHPGQSHPLLAPYFMADAPDRATAEEVIRRLQQFEIVEAAYLKPEEQPP